MPKKIRDLKAILLKAGFFYRPAKGSHTFWTHPLIPDEPVTIAGKMQTMHPDTWKSKSIVF
ncbi:type II toxin-antitoxin system HicA family toxin [Nostoc sp.]|uniref:type II toxin-antitoxin system HicA family toxin n=1 Tax=Nostoc sp. TaxID=1180 RepID=UPI003FA54EF0